MMTIVIIGLPQHVDLQLVGGLARTDKNAVFIFAVDLLFMHNHDEIQVMYGVVFIKLFRTVRLCLSRCLSVHSSRHALRLSSDDA